jgi:dihydroflavonol-4-reductase
MKANRTVLITGISGFIAKHCAIELLNHGYEVRGSIRSLARSEDVRATLSRHADASRVTFVEADLMTDSGWGKAVDSIDSVLHVASPFTVEQPKDENEMIRPAVDGTMRVLRAAGQAAVKRFVQTSSSLAITAGHPSNRTAPITEADWSVLEAPGINPYTKSKTLAERAARDHMAKSKSGMHYCSVNPGFVLGPLLDRDIGASGEAIRMFLAGKYPGAPKLAFPVVDVRDVALMHRLALETTEPSGGRYMGLSEVASFIEVLRPIKETLGSAARKVPRFELPNALVRMVALFDPAVRGFVHELGLRPVIDNTRTRKALGMEFRPVTESAPAMAKSIFALGLV